MFLGIGEAKAKNEAGCTEGELHTLLILCRLPPGAALDEAHARKGAAFAGWKHVKVERSAKLPGPPAEPSLRAAYEDALALGCSVIADRRTLAPARKARKSDRRGKEGEA